MREEFYTTKKGETVLVSFNESEKFDSVSDFKTAFNLWIDNQTQENIFKGFQFGNLTFSMSLTAQINWSNLNFIPEVMFPLSIMSKDDKEYSLTFANRPAFYGAALVYKNSCLQVGNQRKKSVSECTTIKQLKDLADGWGFSY